MLQSYKCETLHGREFQQISWDREDQDYYRSDG